MEPPFDLLAYQKCKRKYYMKSGLFHELAPNKLKTVFTNISAKQYCL